jgi:hypothetical protein
MEFEEPRAAACEVELFSACTSDVQHDVRCGSFSTDSSGNEGAMTEIQDVTGTAFVVAEYRAQENAEQNPLYRDPIVPLFLSGQTRRAAE